MNRIRKVLPLIALIAVLPAWAAEQEIESTFGDWSKICTLDEASDTRVCQIVQSANQNDQLVFQSAIGYVEGNEQPIMYLTAPLGIFLPKGITVIVEENPGLTAIVQRCDGKGCLALLALEDATIDAMRKGTDAKIIFAANAQQNVSLPLSLDGFTAAFRSLSD